jgi:hypothetical protein
MNEEKFKTCRYCAQQVKSAAKICPHCRQWLALLSFRNISVMTAIMLVWMFILEVGLFVLVDRLTNRGIDFAPYRGRISVVQSRMCCCTNLENQPEISVVAVITNQTDKEWKEIEFDARYFDKAGKFIDLGRGEYNDTLYPKTDGAIRINATMLFPATNYDSYKIYIGSACDAHSRF